MGLNHSMSPQIDCKFTVPLEELLAAAIDMVTDLVDRADEAVNHPDSEHALVRVLSTYLSILKRMLEGAAAGRRLEPLI